jgi:inosine-uridine nucleoside N-ribohydrolase
MWTMATKAARFLALALVFTGFQLAGPGARSAAAQAPHRVIIDTDPGTDDALAILLAFNSPEVKVEGITVVAGNVTEPVGLDDALGITALAGRCDVPVAGGAKGPLHGPLVVEPFWNGANGLGGAQLPPTRCKADSHFGPDLIIDLVHKYPHEITLIPVGPETNIALAVLKDPSIVPLVKGIVLMGGSISGGNVNGAAEFNIFADPEAADVVFNAGWPVTMVGLDVTEVTLIKNDDVAQLEKNAGPEAKFAVDIAKFQIGLYESTAFGGGAIHDALAVGAAIDPSFLTTKPMHVDVETAGRFARGETIGNRHGTTDKVVAAGDHFETVGVNPIAANVNVAVGIDSARFIKFFVSRLQGK